MRRRHGEIALRALCARRVLRSGRFDTRRGVMVAFFEHLAESNLRVGLILTALALAAYSNVIGGPLFFDDLHFISWNEHVTGFEVSQIYRSSVTEGAGFASNTYRPNQQLVFALIHRIFGVSPQPYHVTSILIHLCNSVFLFALLCRLQVSRPAALVAAIVFVVHPIQSQAVSYVAGLAGPLALFFLLLGLIQWIASLKTDDVGRRGIHFAAAVLLFAAAFTSKGNMVILAPVTLVIASYLVLIGSVERSRYLVGSVACWSAMAFGFLYLKLTVLNFTGGVGMVEGSNVYTEYLHIRIFTFISVLPNYVELILWPAVLSYSKPDIRYLSPFTIDGAMGLIVLAAGILALWRARQRPLVFLGMGWFFAALAPFSGVIPLTSMYLEHWLYAPMVGVAILLAAAYESSSPKPRQIAISLLIVVALLGVARTAQRNRDWADAERFYSKEMEVSGESVRMLNNLASSYKEKGEYDEAIATFHRLIAFRDVMAEPHDNLAQIHIERGELSVAEAEFRRALEIAPDYQPAMEGLRDIYDRRGQTNEAFEMDRQLREMRRDSGR
jgi:hypothetical protein